MVPLLISNILIYRISTKWCCYSIGAMASCLYNVTASNLEHMHSSVPGSVTVRAGTAHMLGIHAQCVYHNASGFHLHLIRKSEACSSYLFTGFSCSLDSVQLQEGKTEFDLPPIKMFRSNKRPNGLIDY